jgi:small-conductance mechanosensitive channel
MNWKNRINQILEAFERPLVTIGQTEVTLAGLTLSAVIILATFWLSWALRKAIRKIFSQWTEVDQGSFGVALRMLHYLLIVTGIGVALHTVGINLTALFAAGALFAVAIGFAMQNLTANFVSGVILLAERAIKPGDVLDFEGQMVRVRDMGIRSTVARTLNDEDLVIPNSQIVQSTVRNYTFRDLFYRLRVVVGVSYSSDLRLVRETLETTARDLAWRSPEKDPVVLLADFANSSVDFEVSVWIEDPWRSRRGRSDLREAIWWGLKEAGITIAFPQVDVHFDEPVVDSLKELRRAV